jgi:type IV pilus assembly protein PilW
MNGRQRIMTPAPQRLVRRATRHAARPPTGFTLVELMVGLALGLFLLAAAGLWLTSQTQAQRRTLADARLDQDLRAAADLLARDLRRAGYWGHAATTLARRAQSASAPANPYAEVYPAAASDVPAAAAGALGYAYSRDAEEDDLVDPRERFGLRLNPATQALELRQSGASARPDDGDRWQPLTDPRVVRVTGLAITVQHHHLSLLAQCPVTTCSPSDTACPPTVDLREFQVRLEGERPQAPGARRTIDTRVRVRNDQVSGQCPA